MPTRLPIAAARRILLLALAVGVLVDVLAPGNATGINAVIGMAALLGAAALVAGRDGLRRVDPVDAWLPVAALAFAAMPAIRADDWLVLADVGLAAALALGTIACLAGARITRGLVPALVDVALDVLLAGLTGAVDVLRSVRGRGRHGAADAAGADPGVTDAIDVPRPTPDWLRRSIPFLRGLVLAVPVLALFGLLFASADAVFAQLADTVLSWRPDIDLTRALDHTAWISAGAWVAAGLLALAAGLLPGLGRGATAHRNAAGRAPAVDAPPPPPWHQGGSLGAASAAQLRQPLRLGSVEAATILALVDLLFAGFVVLQLAYLFGGRDTMSVTGLTYAEYARRGFFELVAVAVLAGLLVIALDLGVRERGRAQLAASLVLLGLTGVVLLSAFLRLRLYQDMYGWTELRFVVLTAICWLAVALVIAGWLLLARLSRWTLHALGILTLVTVGLMNVVGPQAFVAERNIERALDPALVPVGGRVGLDGEYLWLLGDEAIVPLVDAWDQLPEDARAGLYGFLSDRKRALATDPSLQGWPAWNLTRVRAEDALAGW